MIKIIFARFIMKGVVCCDRADTLEQYGKSVTKDRLRFQNFCLQRMEKKEHFIGVDAIAKQLSAAKKELVGVQKSLDEFATDKKAFDSVYNDYTKFIAGNNFALLEKYCDSGRRAKELGIRIEEIKEKIYRNRKG